MKKSKKQTKASMCTGKSQTMREYMKEYFSNIRAIDSQKQKLINQKK